MGQDQSSNSKNKFIDESDHKTKADKLIAEAKKLSQPKSNLWSDSNSERKSAIELFKQGANFYKLAGLQSNAGYALLEAGKLSLELETANYQTAMMFKDAATCLANANSTTAISVYEQAVWIFINGSGTHFKYAAQCIEAMAEIYIRTNQNSLAIKSYMLASTYYEADGSTVDLAKCYYQIMCLSMEEKMYDDAILYAEKYADFYNGKQYGSSKVQSVLLSAGLCSLGLADLVSTNKKISTYLDNYACFAKSAEYNFLADSIKAYEDSDSDFFLDPKYKLDKYQIAICNRIHNKFKTEEDDLC